MKPPGGGGGHNRTAKDDALVNKQKNTRGAWPASFTFKRWSVR